MKKLLSNKKFWIIASVVLVVLIAAGVTTALLLVDRESEETSVAPVDNKIYWNVDRLIYFDQGEEGMSSRERNTEDGYYHILFSVDGRPTERRAMSQAVINKIDDNDAMGLVLDEKTRVVTGVRTLEEMGAYYYCKNFYIMETNPETYEFKINSSATLLGLEMDVKIKTTTPVVDVSTQASVDAGLPVKFESLEKGDRITMIKDKDDNIIGLYITKRSAKLNVYWNLDRKYDKTISSTTRTPDADGVYHILTAMGGQQVEVVCKDKDVVSKMDGSVCCGLAFDKEGYAIQFISVSRCIGGKSAASWFCVDNIEENTLTLHKYITGANDSGQDRTIDLSTECEIYNVSKNVNSFRGEPSEVKVGDTIAAYKDATERVVLLYVVGRYTGGDVYWNVYRSWNSVTLASKRKPQSDGYYHYIMAHDGTTLDLKVASKALADKIDSIPARTMSLTISNGFILDCDSSSGKQYVSKASWFDVMSFPSAGSIHAKKNTSGSSNYGQEVDVDIASDCKIYNVSEMFDDHLGEETTLRVGDRIQGWADSRNQLKYVFVIERPKTNAVTAHKSNHTCKDCGKNVTWTPWTSANALPTTSGHYYLCGDVVPKITNIEANQNVVICLNGYSIRAGSMRVLVTYNEGSKLTIDNCGSTGKIYSKYLGDLTDMFGGILWARKGNITVYNTTIVAPEQKLPGNGGAIYASDNTTFSLYNCQVIGGNVGKNGGAIFISNANLILEDTTVKAGHADGGKGDAVYLTSKSKITVGGKVVIDGGKSNLYLSSAALSFDKSNPIKEESHIGINTVSSTGKVSSNYITGSEEYFTSDTTDRYIAVADNAIFAILSYKVENHNAHTCKDCDASVEWTPWVNPKILPTESGHYYLCGDVSVGKQYTVAAGEDVVICLNGHNIISSAKRCYLVNGVDAKLTLMDCTGKGKVYNSTGKNNYDDTGHGRLILVGGKSTLNVFDITVESPSYTSPVNGGAISGNAGSTITVKNATIKGGPVDLNGGAINIGGNSSLTLEDVNITAGEAAGLGDAICVGTGTTVNLAGKINITGGKDQIYLTGSLLHLNGAITADTPIKVDTSASDGKFTDNYIFGCEDCFESGKDNYSVAVNGGALYLVKASGEYTVEDHTGHKCKDCDSNAEWTAWIYSDTLPTESGHYYLCGDVTVTTQTDVIKDTDIVICLNGHNITSKGKRVIYVHGDNAKLTLMDCKATGKVIHDNASASYTASEDGGMFNVRENAVLKIFDITVDGSDINSLANGGVINAANKYSKVFIENATIIGGKVAKNGGAINMYSDTTLTLKDVVFVSGTAETNGDAINIGQYAYMHVEGMIDVQGGTRPVVVNNTNGKSYIHLAGALTAGSNILVDVADVEQKLSDNYVSGAEDYIKSARAGYEVRVNGSKLYLVDETTPPPTPSHTDHKCKDCDTDVSWTAWTSATTLPTTSGHYYLENDVVSTVSSFYEVKADNEVVLCLNGHTITSKTKRVYYVHGNNAKLTLMDCKESGKIIHNNPSASYSASDDGGMFNVRENAVLKIFDITVDGSDINSAANGGVINMANKYSKVFIENATIIGGTVAKNGGAINVYSDTTLTLKNATIVAGSATGTGDAIHIGQYAYLHLEGKVDIQGGTQPVYINNTNNKSYIHLNGALTAGSNVVVDVADVSKKVSDNYVSGAENYIKSGKSGYITNANSGGYIELITGTLSTTSSVQNSTISLEPKAAALVSLLPTLSLFKGAGLIK